MKKPPRAAKKLQSAYIPSIAVRIGFPRRGKPPAWAVVTEGRDASEIALVVTECILRPRSTDDDELPSRQQVALEIARALGVEWKAGKAFMLRVGMALLAFAADAKLIRPITRGISKKNQPRFVTRVELTDEAKAQLASLAPELAASDITFANEPQLKRPAGDIEVRKNRLGKLNSPALPAGYVKALNTIRNTKWRVNRLVLNTMWEELNEGRARYLLGHGALRRDGEPSRKSYVTNKDRLLALAMAKKFEKQEFYFDVYCDFRGRVYQDGALRYTGADSVVQSLLEFAEGEAINDAPPVWGGKHLAACIGKLLGEKRDLEDAAEWTETNEALLLSIAKSPRKVHKWRDWPDDKRWPALALADAWRRYREGQPVHTPVSWDAVCSGLQVYSLLMRDKALGALVGLTHDSQGKYYETVAANCPGKEDRNTVKAVCVPLLYGSGWETSEEGLTEHLVEEGQSTKDVHERALAIRREAMRAAPAFGKVRRWLSRSVAREIFKPLNKPIQWTTPLGFSVVQDSRTLSSPLFKTTIEGPLRTVHRNGKKRRIRTPIEISTVLVEPTNELDHDKQRSSLAANVIHSLDANVLVATVNEGSRKPVKPYKAIRNWGVVHDCFAVHPNDAYHLRVNASRFALWAVFGQDWLAELHQQLEAQAKRPVPKPPEHPPTYTAEFQQGNFALMP